MFFKRLELVGFKSFCNKTTLHFEPGITAVVGPNGCGKSNIFDSIRWVLGEQSVKELRGSDMQDVIFNGTDSKEALGMSEVTLTFDNKQKYFPVDNEEVAITRRLFRSGESEYLLNKTQVRLKDILELLMGTGIGAESYSLIQQGKIDLVLSSRPEDRRLVFDEAAGITKYKAQKRETIRKLEETEQNLLRVNDIVIEVKRQIGSLERQANKARRYKESFDDLKAKEILLAFFQKREFEEKKKVFQEEIASLIAREAELSAVIQQQEAKISNRQSELKGLEDRIMEMRDRILTLENTASRNSERIAFNKEKTTELTEGKAYLLEQTVQIKARLTLDEEKLNKVRQEYESIRKNVEDKEALLRQTESSLSQITSSIRNSLEAMAQAKKNILEFASKIASVKNSISDLNAKHQILLARQKRLELEKAKVAEEKSQGQDSLGAIAAELETLQKAFDELNLSITAIKGSLDAESLSLKSTAAEIEELEREKISLQSHKQFLETLRTKYEDISESMNAVVYMDKPPAEKMGGLVVKIKDYMEINEKDRSLSELAVFKLAGEAKPIDLDTQHITQKIAGVQERIAVLSNEKTGKEGRISALNAQITQQQEALRSQEMNLVNKKANHQTLLEQFNRIKEEEEIILLELSEVTGQMAAFDQNCAGLQSELSNLEQAHAASEASIHTEQENVDRNSELKEDAVVSITQAKTELDALNKRVGLESATLKILQDTYEQDKLALINLERQGTDMDSRLETLSAEILELEKQIEQAKLDTQSSNEMLAQAQARYDEASNASIDVVKKIEMDRQALDKLKNSLHEAQMQAKDSDFKYQGIKERLLQAYKVDMNSQQEEFIQGQPQDPSALSQEISRLKEKLDSYGSVNLVAIEEYDELKKRYDFLTQQHTDLTTAKDALHEAILKINRTTKKMFLDTFELIKTEFRSYFKLLFNGGDAQIFLIDEQDPLESGIEIICRPPGKKLQNVLLLSGGEKSMSAIALIFAIFKIKPAPFCVLDEIDAALDEANVDRYSRLLQDFAKTSQFIVITHNKKTIANADVMYGITMEESGVSKIVSVKFAKDKDKDAQAQTAPVA